MCGTGCDCPSEVKELCSCESLCNYPEMCCGGCFVGNNPNVQNCPTTVAPTGERVTFTTKNGYS